MFLVLVTLSRTYGKESQAVKLVSTGQIPFFGASRGHSGTIPAGTEIELQRKPDGGIRIDEGFALGRIKKGKEIVRIPLQLLMTHADYVSVGRSDTSTTATSTNGKHNDTSFSFAGLRRIFENPGSGESCLQQLEEDVCRRAKRIGLFGHPLWDMRSSAEFIQKCAPAPLRLVKRAVNPNKKCSPEDLRKRMSESEWYSCIDPEICDEVQAKIIESGYERSLAVYRKDCKFEGQRTTASSDRSPAAAKKRIQRTVRTTSKGGCLVPLTKDLRTLVVHHTASPVDFDVIDAQNFHLKDKKYTDLGYHYMIAPDSQGIWRVYEGRNIKTQGAHGGAGLNSDSLGIVIAGNYEPTVPDPTRPITATLQPPPGAVEQLIALVQKLKAEHPSISKVMGHGEFQHSGNGCHTQCPGPGCQHLVNHLNRRFFSKKGGTP